MIGCGHPQWRVKWAMAFERGVLERDIKAAVLRHRRLQASAGKSQSRFMVHGSCSLAVGPATPTLCLSHGLAQRLALRVGRDLNFLTWKLYERRSGSSH
jgi:hypothetical protein